MTRPHEDVIREALEARQRGTGSTRNTRPALDALAALVDERNRLREALGRTRGPYRIAGIPPGIISADDYDVTDEVLAVLALAASPGDKPPSRHSNPYLRGEVASGPDEQEAGA